MVQPTPGSLISTKPSDSGLSVALHPLVLLTVSDQITRHRVRKQETPVAGILLGQQKGREITAEHAFPLAFDKDSRGSWIFKEPWLETRIQQFKDVHKAPVLEVVGWFTLCPEDGPTSELVHYQKQITNNYNESGILLALHPEAFASTNTTGGKLPLSVYESVVEGDAMKDEGSMQVDGEESAEIKFRSIPYFIETDETEMIAIDYVAKGAGSAAAVIENDETTQGDKKPEEQESEEKKGKKRADVPQETTATEEVEKIEKTNILTTDEEDQIAGITTRINSVKMLQSRLSLLSNFIQSLPASYLSHQNTPLTATSPDPQHLPHLRNIQALITRLSLLTPVDSTSASNDLIEASQAQHNDVALASLLSMMGQDVQGLSELGKKFATVDTSRSSKRKSKPTGGFGGVTYGGMDQHDGRVGGFAVSGNMLV